MEQRYWYWNSTFPGTILDLNQTTTVNENYPAMNKQHAWPDGHWNWPIRITHKHGLRCGNMIWIGGQVDLSSHGGVLNPGDLAAQTAAVMKNFSAVLQEFDCGLSDLVYLNAFYVNDGSVDEGDFLEMIAEGLPAQTRTAITPVPVD